MRISGLCWYGHVQRREDGHVMRGDHCILSGKTKVGRGRWRNKVKYLVVKGESTSSFKPDQ